MGVFAVCTRWRARVGVALEICPSGMPLKKENSPNYGTFPNFLPYLGEFSF